MSKKIFSALLALCMVTALAVPAMATGNITVPGVPNITSTNTGSNSAETELKGTIVATTLKVTVPTKITFDIDPTINVSSPVNVTGQLTNVPSTIEITNGSLVPVYAKINKVVVTQGVTLVNTESDLGTDKAVMFAYKETGKVTGFTNTADWLMTTVSDSAPYELNSDGGKIAAGEKLTMQMCAQTINGWAAGDNFTITPTIVVSTSAT